MSESSEPSGTLYDPPDETTSESSANTDRITLRMTLPSDRADRLRAVAQQLGLSPSLVAKRAIELVCDEVVTVQKDDRSTSVLIDEYQARLDLLHTVDAPKEGRLEPPDQA